MFFKKRIPSDTFDSIPKETGKVSILICSPDFQSSLALRCIESVKRHTTNHNFELILLENGKFGSFSHPSEINRAMSISRGEFFVTLDDDVEVTEGWLDALLDCAKPGVGAVGCINLNLQDNEHKGTIRHVGGFVREDGSVFSYNKEIDKPINCPFVCSSCLLILNQKIEFPTIYEKYYHEAHFCLQNWEAGFEVVVSPHKIYHFGGGTMESLGYSRKDIHSISDRDKEVFLKAWNKSGRLGKLYNKIEKKIPFNLK